MEINEISRLPHAVAFILRVDISGSDPQLCLHAVALTALTKAVIVVYEVENDCAMANSAAFDFQNVAGREAKRRLMDEPLR